MQPHAPITRLAREQRVEQLQKETFDLLVIGGGINGAGVARDAALRGLRVALIEKADFGSGTSSRSSKLIHGGIRYLQQGDFRLVRIACRERDLLRRRLAPHLVRPLAFLFPVYRNDPVGVFALGLGMWLYDLLAIFRNIRRHRMRTASQTLALEPTLRSEGLRGAALYYDCFTDDARLTLETVLGAEEEGALVGNYLELRSFIKEQGRLAGAIVQDQFGGSEFAIRARCVVNATGPWADHVRRLDDASVTPCLRLTKGVHVVVPRERIGNAHAVVLRSPQDQRILFVIPWQSHAIIGTTDTDFTGSPEEVTADDQDVDYLLTAANWFFPTAKLCTADVVSSYAGLRPLVAPEGGAQDPSAVSREEEILESPSGLITLAGGKLTTYRFVAAEIVSLAAKRLGRAREARRISCKTATTPLPGGRAADPKLTAEEVVARNGSELTLEQVHHLAQRYGSRTMEVVELVRNDAKLKQMIVPGLPEIWAEAAYAARNEMALHPDDILERRTHVALKQPLRASQVTEKLRETLRLFRR